MTKLTPRKEQLLKAFAVSGALYISAQANHTDYTTARRLHQLGLVEITEENNYGDTYQIAPAGLAYLYQDAPMVDQPQPAPETTPIKFTRSYAYSPRESATAQGNIHIQVIDPVTSGQLVRREYQALCRKSFWGLLPVHNAQFGHVCPKCAEIKARLESRGFVFQEVKE